MPDDVSTLYPGADASPFDLLCLARTYRAAATQLLHLYAPGVRMSLAPMRLCAFHATELYLAAYLREMGVPPREVRSFRHDTARMAFEAQRLGLSLKKKVQERLQKVRDNREYLVSRYDPQPPKLLEPNAILPTLDELEKKVAAAVKWKRAPEGALHVVQVGKITQPAWPSPPA